MKAPTQRISNIPGVKPGRHPGFVEPQLAKLRDDPPAGDYVHEIKFDGYRLQAQKRGGLVSLWTRGGLNWTKRFPTIAAALDDIPATELVMDGEVISANEQGTASFSQLQDDLSKSRYDRMVYYAFDLIHLEGFDLRGAALIERKRVLEEFLKSASAPIHFSQHFETDGAVLFRQACELGFEGIISKLKTSTYKWDRTPDWQKVKCIQTARFEVIGYKNGATSLYLAKRAGKDLIYVGKAGTGFTNSMVLELAKLLKPITLEKMPLSKKPDRKNKIDNWAAPKYWAEVGYRDITTDGLLRHVTFFGLYPTKASKKPIVGKFR